MEQAEINLRLNKLQEFLRSKNNEFEFKPSYFFEPRLMKIVKDLVELGVADADYKISLKEGLLEDPIYQEEIENVTIEDLYQKKSDIESHRVIIKEFTEGAQ
ncbi:MAG: hypothetical protein Q8O62_13295 [Aequorivita sp.]|nr:hypothetical protein [Aequorivita sp.]